MKDETYKRLYPHHYELHMLGGINTEEGQDYYDANKLVLESEFYIITTTFDERNKKIGGSRKIHILES